MTVMLSISPDAEARLRERAAASGQPVDVYASRLLEQVVTAPTVDELLGPARRQIAESGMSDQQLDEFLEDLREKVWQEKQHGH